MGVLGCQNCVNGWVLFQRPANKVKVNGSLIYSEEKDGVMVDFAAPCPYCNGGQAYIEDLKQKADLPTTYYDVDMDSFDWSVYGVDVSRQKMLAEKWILEHDMFRREGMGLYIWSRTRGSGKTYLASAICNSMMKTHRKKTRFVNLSKLIDISKEKDGIRQLIDAEILVLDDLGQSGSGADWVGDLLYEIFEERGNRNRLCIVTSNIRPTELKMDDRVVDRMNQKMIGLRLPEVRVRALKASEAKKRLLIRAGVIQSEQLQMNLKTE